MKINNSPRFTAFTAKRCKKYAVKIFFFTAFHRISYENSPPNLDPGNMSVCIGIQPVLFYYAALFYFFCEFLCLELFREKQFFIHEILPVKLLSDEMFLVSFFS